MSVTSVSIRPRAWRRDRPWKIPAVTLLDLVNQILLISRLLSSAPFTPRQYRCWKQKFCQNECLVWNLFSSCFLLSSKSSSCFLLIFLFIEMFAYRLSSVLFRNRKFHFFWIIVWMFNFRCKYTLYILLLICDIGLHSTVHTRSLKRNFSSSAYLQQFNLNYQCTIGNHKREFRFP